MPLRQFTMQHHGATLQYYNTDGDWTAIPVDSGANPWGVAAPMCGWYATKQLDLRGLLAGDESGINFANVVLQEPQEIRALTSARETGIFMIDVLTTVRPTERAMAGWFRGVGTHGTGAGFLQSPGTAVGGKADATSQTFNPSQVVWGLWRLITTDPNVVLSDVGLGTFGVRTLNSGYFGEGETVVAPALFWTRVIFGFKSDNTAGAYPVFVPSANLVVLGEALDLTTPQEITQMMRASQR